MRGRWIFLVLDSWKFPQTVDGVDDQDSCYTNEGALIRCLSLQSDRNQIKRPVLLITKQESDLLDPSLAHVFVDYEVLTDGVFV